MSGCIPQEVLVEILTRVPPKSLLRFRCVSKSWLCVISSSTFISMHAHQTTLTKSENTHSLVRRYSETDKKELYSIHLNNETFDIDEQVKIELPIKYSWGKYFRIVGSCDGLLCLSDDIFGYTNTIILWNPSIRRKLTLPRPYATFDKVGAFKSALGFGLDTKTNEYKVVRITYLEGGDDNAMPPMVEIYVLGAGNWRALSGAFPQYYMVDQCWSQAFINGKVHWVAFYGREGCGTWVHSLIMTFDMRDEVFEGMMLPEGLACEYPFHMYANVVRESLSIFHYSRGLQCQSCSIWVMKEYGVAKSWSKQFNVDLEEGLGEILCLRNNGEILLATRGGELVSYDAVTQRSLNLGLIGTAASFYVDIYKESLSLLIEGKEDSGTQASNNISSLSDGEYESEDDGVENLNF